MRLWRTFGASAGCADNESAYREFIVNGAPLLTAPMNFSMAPQWRTDDAIMTHIVGFFCAAGAGKKNRRRSVMPAHCPTRRSEMAKTTPKTAEERIATALERIPKPTRASLSLSPQADQPRSTQADNIAKSRQHRVMF
jgi:hypothetical protein